VLAFCGPGQTHGKPAKLLDGSKTASGSWDFALFWTLASLSLVRDSPNFAPQVSELSQNGVSVLGPFHKLNFHITAVKGHVACPLSPIFQASLRSLNCLNCTFLCGWLRSAWDVNKLKFFPGLCRLRSR
jgi:hypothetical protein